MRKKGTLLFLLAVLIGCDTAQELETSSTGVRLNQDVLHFSSKNAFDRTVADLQKDQSKLDEWERQFQGYVSMRTAYDHLTKDDLEKISMQGIDGYENILSITGEGDDREIVRNIDDDIMASLVNQDGLLYIGNDAFKVTYNNLIRITDGVNRGADLRHIYSTAEIKNQPNVEIQHVERRILNSTLKSKVSAVGRDETCYRDYTQRSPKRKNRLKGEIWSTDLGALYSSIGARTRHQERILGAWFADKIPQIRLIVTGQVQQLYGAPPPIVEDINFDTGILYNSSGESNTFQFCIGVPCEFTINYMTTTHWGVCDDNVVRSCSVTW